MIRVISIGYEREFLDAQSPASSRLAKMVSSEFPMTAIILSRGADAYREAPQTRAFGFSGNGIVRLWKAFWKIVGEIKRARKDGEQVILSAQDPMTAGMLAFNVSRWMNAPYEVQEHGDFFSGEWEREHFIKNRVLAWCAGFLLKRADAVRVVSERVKARLIGRFGLNADRVYVKPVEMDLSWHLGISQRLDSEIGSIIVPCRFVKQKGLDVLLRALADVKSRGILFKLRLIGKGPLESKVRDLILSLGLRDLVSIDPWSSQEALWGNGGLFVCSSNFEGWGRTIVEAMASRLPIVTTDVGCVGSVFRPQIDGRVVPVGNVKALADAIAEQLTEKERRDWMVEQAYDRAKEFASKQHEAFEVQKSVWREVNTVGRKSLAVSRTAWKWTFLLISSAIALRALSVVLFWKSLGANREWGFFTLVQNWFLGNGYSYVNAIGCASAYRSPGYLFILTAIYGIFGFANFLAQAVIQNIVAVVLVYAVYRLAVELFNDRRIGLVAGVIAMFHPYTFYHYTQYYHTVFSSLFIVLIVYFALKFERTKRLRWAIGCGIWVAALAYIQGTILPAMPFIALWLLIRWRREWKKAIGAIALIAIVSVAMIAPWTYRNWTVFHSFVPLTTDLGHGLAKANNDHIYYYNLLGYPQEAYEETPITDDGLTVTYAMLPEVAADMQSHGFKIPVGYFMNGIHPIEPSYRYTCTDQSQMNEVEFNRYWIRKTTGWIRENYSSTGWKIELQKLGQFWSPILQPTKRYGAAWSFGNEGLIATLVKLALAGYVVFLEVGSLIALYLLTKKKNLGRIAPILILLVVYSFMHSWFVGYTKYRIPLDGFLAILSSFAIISLWDLKKRVFGIRD